MATITSLIKKFLKDSGIPQVHLAELLEESPQNLANKLRKRDLDSDYIRRVSIALNHDFFLDLSKELRLRPKPDSRTQAESTGYFDPAYVRLLEENIELYRQIHKSARS